MAQFKKGHLQIFIDTCNVQFDYRGHGHLRSDVELECMEEVGYYSSSIGPYLMHSSDKVD